MRYPALAAVAAVLALTSCAEMRHFKAPPDPHNPGVFVAGSQIVVGQDPLVIPPGDSAAIVWHLRAASNYRFPDNGITIANAGEEFRCAREGETTFVCQNRHSKRGEYKYTIRVLDGDKPLEPLDPFIYNQ